MKTVIAGSRGITDYEYLCKCMKELDFSPTLVISGGAKGVDSLGEWWAQERGILVKVYPANWSKYGCASGHIRNEEMAKVCDAIVVIWDGRSPGSKGMISLGLKYKRIVKVFNYEKLS